MERSKRRKTESIRVVTSERVRDSVGGFRGQEIEDTVHQETLASVRETGRNYAENAGTSFQFRRSVEFTFFVGNYEITPSMFIKWRANKLSIQSISRLEDVRKVKVVCVYPNG